MSEPGQLIDTDVLIVGGGLVGTLLAHALLAIPVRVVLVEARQARMLEQPSFDGRATALASGTVRILERLGLWSSVLPDAEKIEHIHIGQQGRFGAARIHAREEGVAALGFTAENRVLGDVFWQRLERHAGFECLSPATLDHFDADKGGVTATVTHNGAPVRIRARLLVAADGARSSVREALGVDARASNYGQKAIVANCAMEDRHQGWAFERFTPRGPLALLPLTEGRCALVWTFAAAEADEMLARSEAEFSVALQHAFGFRLGRVRRVGARAAHPLFRLRSDAVTGPRTVLIGNAAVSMHPVAGQSFNLAVRDVATLAELIADVRRRSDTDNTDMDIGDAALLARYRHWRAADQRNVSWFTHGLVTGMGLEMPGLAAVRGLGLIAFDLLPGAKRALARHTMGLGGRVPRLARGLDL